MRTNISEKASQWNITQYSHLLFLRLSFVWNCAAFQFSSEPNWFETVCEHRGLLWVFSTMRHIHGRTFFKKDSLLPVREKWFSSLIEHERHPLGVSKLFLEFLMINILSIFWKLYAFRSLDLKNGILSKARFKKKLNTSFLRDSQSEDQFSNDQLVSSEVKSQPRFQQSPKDFLTNMNKMWSNINQNEHQIPR